MRLPPAFLALLSTLACTAAIAQHSTVRRLITLSVPLPDRDGDGRVVVSSQAETLGLSKGAVLVLCPGLPASTYAVNTPCPSELPRPRTIDGLKKRSVVAKNGAVKLGTHTGPIYVTGAYRAIETTPATIASDVVIDGLIADDLQRSGVRLRGKLTNVILRNSRFRFRSIPQVPPNLPACLEVGDKAESRIEGFLVQNVTCEGFQMTMPADRYWNGDGPTFESNVAGLVLDNVTSRNSTDGCFDIKPVARATRIEAEGCKRNVRIWRGLDADQVTTITPIKRGGAGRATHLWIHGNDDDPPVVHIGKLVVRSTTNAPIITVEDGKAVITIDACDLRVPVGTLFRVGGAGTKVTLGEGCKLG